MVIIDNTPRVSSGEVQSFLETNGFEVPYVSVLATCDRYYANFTDVFLFGLSEGARQLILDTNTDHLPISARIRPDAIRRRDALFVGTISESTPEIDRLWLKRILRSPAHPVNGAARLIIRQIDA